MTGQGGWPTTVFLTPDGRPFYAGTYFPPEPRHGLPSFRQLLQAVAEAWRDRRDDLEAQAERLVGALGGAARLEAGDEPLSAALLDAAERGLARDFEPAFGGFGTAPKFPPASAIELLLRRGGAEALGMVRRTLDGMAAGGLYDVVGGGFHRYSVDARWLVPHFEKMLYDNALLASAYLHAWVVTGEERYREVVEETVELPAARAAAPGAAGSPRRRTPTPTGSRGSRTPGRPRRVGPRARRSAARAVRARALDRARRARRGDERERLLAVRAERPQPFRDDKAIASWNGLALAALAEAARRLERADWLAAADAARGVPARPALAARTAACCGAAATAGSAAAGSSTTTRTSPTACSSCTSRPARSAGCSRRAGSRPRASSCSPTTSTAASSSRRATARRSSHADEGPRRRPDPVRQLDARLGARPARPASGATTGSSERGVGVLRLVAPALGRVAARVLRWALCALDLHLAPPRELRDRRPASTAAVARAALAPFAAARRSSPSGPSDDVPLLAGKTARRRAAGRVRLRALRLPRAGDRPGDCCGELGSAAWRRRADRGGGRRLGSLRSLRGHRRPAHRARSSRGRGRRRRVPRALPRQGRASSTPPSSPRPSPSTSGSSRRSPAPLTYAHLLFATNMADPARGALVARLQEKAAALETQLLFFGLEWAALEDDARRASCSPTRRSTTGATSSASLRKFRPYLLTEPEERIVTEKARLGRLRVVAPLRGAARRAARRRSTARRSSLETAMARLYDADRDDPRGRCGGGHRGARARASDAHVRLQHDPARQVDRRPAARLPDLDLRAQPRERDDRRGGPGARSTRRRSRYDVAAALLPAQGAAARARAARALRPLRAGRRGHARRTSWDDARARSSSAPTPTSPTRRATIVARFFDDELDRRARAARQARPARSARRPCPASTRTSS